MNRLRLIDKNCPCPPDQFRYKFREDGWTEKCYSYDGWLGRIKEHRRINGYETPPEWQAEAEDQLCRLLPPGWCQQETGEPPEWFLDSRLTMGDVLRGTAVLGAFVAQGMPLVSKAEAAARGVICAGCPLAINVAGCGPCVGLSNAIAEVAGNEPLPSDTALGNKSCAVCKCAARAQIWLPIELLARGVTELMMSQFPIFCWKKMELQALSKNA